MEEGETVEIQETREPLREQGSIRALLELLEQQGMEQEKGDVLRMADYIDSMEMQLGTVLKELGEVKKQLGVMLWSNTTEEELMKKKEITPDFGQTLYWDYYLYVKEKPITNWNKKTYILYGNKDNMQNEETIKSFSDKFNCELTILEDGEEIK